MSRLGRIGRMVFNRRARIIVIALIVGAFFGVTKLALPLEDILIGARSVLHRHDAPQDIAIISLGDSSLNELREQDAPRSADARLVRNLMDKGARRIFFDRSYHFEEDSAGDRLLSDELARHEGRIFMGAIGSDSDHYTQVSMLPAPIFREHVGVVSLMAFPHPFELSVSFPFKSEAEGKVIPSLAAKLAEIDQLPDGIFRPDYSMDVTSIPKFRYIDVVRDEIPEEEIRGRDFVISPSAITFNDIHRMPFQGYRPGAFFQVMAAQTLKQGIPVKLGWIPAFALVAMVIITGIGRGRSFDRYRIASLATILGVAPLLLDLLGLEAEVVPAALMAAIAIFQARSLDRVEEATEVNVASGLPSLQSLRASTMTMPGNLVALKIRNYGAITGSFASPVEAELAAEIVRRIRIGDPEAVVYHEGDMFLWCSCVSNPVDLFEHLEGLHRIVQNGLLVQGREVDMSFNCGVETEPERPLATRVASALQAAEQAVRRDELVYLHNSLSNDVQWEISLLSQLDRAIDNGEVWVAYQPKLDLATNRIKGAEALVRWTHPERGPISPEQFIGIAEEYHRIERITRFVLNEAAQAAVSLRKLERNFTVSVNISAQLLRHTGLPQMVFDALSANDLDASNLVLEITETERLDRDSKTFSMMQELVDAGLQLSIDDFGTGNATIDYLRYLPAKEVKIDKVFVSGMEENREDLLLVKSIVEMAHSLNRVVVAEGVENEAILEMLREIGCDTVQGFHVSKPIPIEELMPMLGTQALKFYGKL